MAGINQKWFKRIMTMVPKRLQRNHKDIKKIHEEIKEDYLFAVKKSIVDFVLKVRRNLNEYTFFANFFIAPNINTVANRLAHCFLGQHLK